MTTKSVCQNSQSLNDLHILKYILYKYIENTPWAIVSKQNIEYIGNNM